jgi:2'-5' RNA ligase
MRPPKTPVHALVRRLRAAAGALLRRSPPGAPTLRDHRRLTVAVVLPLGGEAGRWMLDQQLGMLQRHGCNPGLDAPPHVTLKMGFKVDATAPVERWLADLAAQIAPFTLRLRGIGRFDEGILFLDVERDAALEALRRHVLAELQAGFGVVPQPIEDDRFHFHATLTYGLPGKALDAEQQRLLALAPAFDVPIDHLALWVHGGEHWVALDRQPLRGHPADRPGTTEPSDSPASLAPTCP